MLPDMLFYDSKSDSSCWIAFNESPRTTVSAKKIILTVLLKKKAFLGDLRVSKLTVNFIFGWTISLILVMNVRLIDTVILSLGMCKYSFHMWRSHLHRNLKVRLLKKPSQLNPSIRVKVKNDDERISGEKNSKILSSVVQNHDYLLYTLRKWCHIVWLVRA